MKFIEFGNEPTCSVCYPMSCTYIISHPLCKRLLLYLTNIDIYCFPSSKHYPSQVLLLPLMPGFNHLVMFRLLFRLWPFNIYLTFSCFRWAIVSILATDLYSLSSLLFSLAYCSKFFPHIWLIVFTYLSQDNYLILSLLPSMLLLTLLLSCLLSESLLVSARFLHGIDSLPLYGLSLTLLLRALIHLDTTFITR